MDSNTKKGEIVMGFFGTQKSEVPVEMAAAPKEESVSAPAPSRANTFTQVSTARRDATSPFPWPPSPSASTKQYSCSFWYIPTLSSLFSLPPALLSKSYRIIC